ncbi:MAG: flagellar biosynthesis anti-sigma factor FlgM [Trichlorobacter sp.]|jgi:anti-sigma28 factor (negative regulator of flagellin synthesis)|nr:flagellar biosynthesis anti-sigma factor FlgM [Trichlorobacter sp.]
MKITSDYLNTMNIEKVSGLRGAMPLKAMQYENREQSPFQVHLTKLVDGIAPATSSTSNFRIDKVAEISKQLADGTYSISGSDVAEKMLLTLRI